MREKIFQLVKRAVELNGRDGHLPDDAIRKVAEENNLNEDFVHRVVATFNTARAVHMFDTHPDKTVKFALADPERVLAGRIRTRAEEIAPSEEIMPVSEHSYSDHEAEFLLTDDSLEREMKKFAGVESAPQIVSCTIFNPLYAYLEERKIELQNGIELRDELHTAAFSELSRVSEKIANMISTDGFDDQLDIPVMESQAMSILGIGFSQFAFDWISEKANYHRKRAELADPHRMVIWSNPEIGAELEHVAELFDHCAKIEFAVDKMASALENSAADFNSLFKSAKGFAGEQRRSKAPGSDEDTESHNELNQSAKGNSGSKDDPFGDSVTGALDLVNEARKATDPETYKTVMHDPEEARALKEVHEVHENTRRQLILQNLLTEDPVLSTEDPKSVSKAYETVVNIAPGVSLNENLVRSILRGMAAQQALGPYEADQLAKLEGNLRKQMAPINPRDTGGENNQ